jgi:hypothetical protein
MKCEDVNGIQLAQDMVQWQDVVNAIMDVRIP